MNKILTPTEMEFLLRNDLSFFIIRTFLEINPSGSYLHNWHIDLIASKLTDVYMGRCKRLIINIPPRNMKSICASIAFPAWLLGRDPTLRIICASYGQELANKLAIDCRNVMQSNWYQKAFPHTRLSSIRGAVHDFMTTQQGGRMATSVGGVITGRGAEILILDDPIKPDEAFSDVTRERANEWFDGTAYSRLNSKRDGAIIIIMQRLHMDDLVGHVLGKEDWEIVSLPAITEEETIFTFNTLQEQETVIRKVGEALHPERESLETLAHIRVMIGEYNFAGQYQQSPVPAGGGMIKTAWLQYLPQDEFPVKFDSIIQSWDTASKVTELSDYSVCTTWGIKDKKVYLLNVWRKRVDYPDLKRAALELYNQFKPTRILIEGKSSGIALIQELKEARIYVAEEYMPEGDKKLRLHQQSIMFESGQITLPEKAQWLADYEHELTSFPTCKFDDQVDSTTQALAKMREQFDEPAFFGYIRMMEEERRKKV